MINQITSGAQTVTTAGAVTGTLDTSGMNNYGPYTVYVEVTALSGGGAAVVTIEDTASSTPFNDAVGQASFQFVSGITAANPVKRSVQKFEMPGVRFGVSNSKLRINVTSLSGTSPSLTVNAWLQ